MKAVVYQGPRDVAVTDVPDAKIERPTDVLVRMTTTNICGSDLHMYEGRTSFEEGRTFGHENMGEVVEIGKGVEKVQVGDRVVLPFNISCGFCKNCERGLTNYCLTTQPDPSAAGAAYGFADMGPYGGGQAELLRVPFGDHNALRLGEDAQEKENDYVMLSDIFPTGYQAVINASVGRGSRVAIYGAGPVGLMAAACARMLGAEQIFMVDQHAYRLAYAQRTYGVIPINFDEIDDPAEAIIEQTPGHRGVDAAIDAVGFEAKGSTTETILTALKLEASSGVALRQCIAAVRRGGTVSVPGVYAGFIHGFLFGDAFDKGLTFKMGQTHVHPLLPDLLEHIQKGDLNPEIIISHRLNLSDAAEGYRLFDKAEDDCRKVILRP